MKQRPCEQCGKIINRKYFDKRSKHYFCDKSCHRTYWNFTDKNPSYHRDIKGENNPMYGRKPEHSWFVGKIGALHPRWKDGVRKRPDGYVRSYVAPYTYVLEHRRVAEEKLGRKLNPEEVVHHIDGNPSNNNPDNIQVFSCQAEHAKI